MEPFFASFGLWNGQLYSFFIFRRPCRFTEFSLFSSEICLIDLELYMEIKFMDGTMNFYISFYSASVVQISSKHIISNRWWVFFILTEKNSKNFKKLPLPRQCYVLKSHFGSYMFLRPFWNKSHCFSLSNFPTKRFSKGLVFRIGRLRHELF